MGTRTISLTKWHILLRLGRVSNLPTVWSNVFTGAVLSGYSLQNYILVVVLIALSLIYVAGMFRNDAFDHKIDIKERPTRPIASGEISARTVFLSGYSILGAGVLMLALTNMAALISGLVLAALVVFYNFYHKGNPLSPLLMGLCRMLVYITSTLAITGGSIPNLVWQGALVLLAYSIGLTYIAKQENFGKITKLWPLLGLAAPVLFVLFKLPWTVLSLISLALIVAWTLRCLWLVIANSSRNIRHAVSGFIAGISLNDALLMSTQDAQALVILGYVAFLLTYLAQRRIAGT
ncbi:MAG: UbiA family prenyltransferase [Gammaproteobacteria bacterium]|nr:UbiA family prenyltransferase [Gammaproteobacteria bacterium]